jgi:hypothetical protein
VRPGPVAFFFFVMALMVSVVFVSTIPQIDLPETAYDESDAPVNQAPPVVLDTTVVHPPIAEVVLPRRIGETEGQVGRQSLEQSWVHRLFPRDQHDQHSMQVLLCTFLI